MRGAQGRSPSVEAIEETGPRQLIRRWRSAGGLSSRTRGGSAAAALTSRCVATGAGRSAPGPSGRCQATVAQSSAGRTASGCRAVSRQVLCPPGGTRTAGAAAGRWATSRRGRLAPERRGGVRKQALDEPDRVAARVNGIPVACSSLAAPAPRRSAAVDRGLAIEPARSDAATGDPCSAQAAGKPGLELSNHARAMTAASRLVALRAAHPWDRSLQRCGGNESAAGFRRQRGRLLGFEIASVLQAAGRCIPFALPAGRPPLFHDPDPHA